METKQIDELKGDPSNPRLISNHDGAALAASMKEFGDLSCIVFNVRTGQLVGGHQRVEVLNKVLAGAKSVLITQRFETPDHVGTTALGYVTYENRQFAYREVDWDEGRQAAANIAANRIQGEFNEDMLAQKTYEISQLPNGAELLKLTGQREDEISKLMDRVGAGEEENDEDIPELETAEPPISKVGEIYQLGPHRLMCGDATNPDHAAALMDGKFADMVWTDPPYNVDYEGKTADALKIENDKFKDGQAFYTFLFDAFTNLHTYAKSGAAIYICHADSEGLNFRRAMLDAKWMQKQNIVWVKNTIVLGRQDYQWQHEPILYGWKEGAAHYFVDDRDKTTVWNDVKDHKASFDGEYTTLRLGGFELKLKGKLEGQIRKAKEKTDIWQHDKPSRSADHPTMKPLPLIKEAVMNSSQRGWLIIDFFGGSGSTMIACDEIARICNTMELDPRYCDVIRKRYANKVGAADWVAETPILGQLAQAEQPAIPASAEATGNPGELTDIPA